jgi:hypothetical protein
LSSKICGPIEAFLYCGQFIFDVGYLDILTWGKKKRLRKETEKQRNRETEKLRCIIKDGDTDG